MDIQLKNINVSSQVAGAFIAQLFIDGIKAGIAHCKGGDRGTYYHHITPKGKKLIAEAELYCRMLSAARPPLKNREKHEELSLTTYIDRLVKDYISQELYPTHKKPNKGKKL